MFFFFSPDGSEGTSAPSYSTGGYPSGPDGSEGTSAPSYSVGSHVSGPDGSETPAPTMAATTCEGRDGTVNIFLLNGKVYPSTPPLELASRSDKFAILELHQTWSETEPVESISAMFLQNGQTVCPGDQDITKDATDSTPLTYTIDCGPGYWATMYLYVTKTGFSGGASDAAVVTKPDICENEFNADSMVSKDTLTYKIQVSCLCDPTAQFISSSAPSFAPSFSPSAAPCKFCTSVWL